MRRKRSAQASRLTLCASNGMLDTRKAARHQIHVALRVVLYRGETYRLARSCPGIRVVDGVAWVTFAGTDIILYGCEETLFQAGRDFAVVSPLGATPLVLEVFARSPQPHRVRQTCLSLGA